MSRRLSRSAVAAVVLCALLTPLTLGASAPAGVRPALCIPLIWCPQPDPTPSSPATSTPEPTGPEQDAGDQGAGDEGAGDQGGADQDADGQGGDERGTDDPEGADSEKDSGTDGDAVADPEHPADPDSEKTATPPPAQPDPDAPVFTGTPAQMASDGLSFSGLRSIGLVTVPTIDGERIRVLKISADEITLTGFSLSVRPPQRDGLVTDADTMSLKGHVTVYLGSLTATGRDGETLLSLGVDTPPSLDDVEPGLLHVSMGLVGTIADSIGYTNTDQRIVASR
ncbi:hypothetical protein Q9R19_07795 [Microbacterium sp. ARD32]|uniref:hypothetical protein n=1 Tax=Microbacterium sp. ARD32 TaxID=2962577 RepID=UPI0028821BDB|nr:hypothetical protein [Microbacterium sp. ARD32]MDT0157520.1 hypothetical protein [Microbacterium sp. ARD32]